MSLASSLRDFLRGRPSKIQSAQQLPQELVDHIIDCSGLVDPCRDLEWNKHLPALHRRELASYTLVSQTWMRSCSKYLLSRIFVNGPPLSSFLAELKTSDRLRWYMTTLVISRTSHPIELNSLIEILALAPNVRNLAIMSIRTDDLLSYDISKPLAHYRMINVALSGPRLSSVPDFLGLFDSIELLRLTDMGRGHDRNHGPEPFLDAVPPAHLDVRDLVLDKCKADLCASLPEILIAGCLRRLTFRTYPFLSITAILACLPQIGQQLTEVTLVCDSTILSGQLYPALGSLPCLQKLDVVDPRYLGEIIHTLFGISGASHAGFASNTVTYVRLTSIQNFEDARPLRPEEVTAVLDRCPALTTFVLSFDAKELPGEDPGWFASSSMEVFTQKIPERHREKITYEPVSPALRAMYTIR